MRYRINFLEPYLKERKRKKNISRFVGLSSILFICILFAAYYAEKKRGEELSTNFNNWKIQRDELLKLEQLAGEKALFYNKLKDDVKTIGNKLKKYENLLPQKAALWSNILEDISENIPEGLWLVNINGLKNKKGKVVDKAENIELEGYSLTNKKIALFTKNLEGLPLLYNVKVASSTAVSFMGNNVFSFNLSCKINSDYNGEGS